jgi:hypothetical protein
LTVCFSPSVEANVHTPEVQERPDLQSDESRHGAPVSHPHSQQTCLGGASGSEEEVDEEDALPPAVHDPPVQLAPGRQSL